MESLKSTSGTSHLFQTDDPDPFAQITNKSSEAEETLGKMENLSLGLFQRVYLFFNKIFF